MSLRRTNVPAPCLTSCIGTCVTLESLNKLLSDFIPPFIDLKLLLTCLVSLIDQPLYYFTISVVELKSWMLPLTLHFQMLPPLSWGWRCDCVPLKTDFRFLPSWSTSWWCSCVPWLAHFCILPSSSASWQHTSLLALCLTSCRGPCVTLKRPCNRLLNFILHFKELKLLLACLAFLLDQSIFDFTISVMELTSWILPLTCTFLNVVVFVHELTT